MSLSKVKQQRYARSYRLRREYGISVEQYDLMLSSQDGVCAICKRPPKTRRLSVDHNHKTGRIRGLLCFRCNKGIGYLRDDSSNARRMVNYLENETGLYVSPQEPVGIKANPVPRHLRPYRQAYNERRRRQRAATKA